MIPGIRDVSFELAWGRSIMEFKPSIRTANQVSSVTVRGWHRTRKVPISRTVTLDDERITANVDLHRVLNACNAREELVVDEPVFTNCEARERAIAILLDQTKELVTAEVKVVGLPDLRAGQIVVIKGVGARLSGKYFVTKTTHTIDDSGYITDFSCRREAGLDS
jgi:phage protein D